MLRQTERNDGGNGPNRPAGRGRAMQERRQIGRTDPKTWARDEKKTSW